MILYILCLITVVFSDMTDQQLISNITNILTSHIVQGQKWGMKYHFYRPGLQKYGPYQWLWDSSFHMISWSRINVTNSILDLRTMLQMQKSNGQIPQIIFWGKQGLQDKILNPLLNSDKKVTDISQMPMLAFALSRIFQETKDVEILKQFVPKLVQYQTWWSTERQPDKDGCIVIIHPWESGLDASPMYDEALGVDNPQPTLLEYYPNFEKLILAYRFQYNWNQKNIVSKKKNNILKAWPSYFVVKQVGVNAVYTASWKILANLALHYNEPLSYYCNEQYKWFMKGTLSLYNPDTHKFVSKYLTGSGYKSARADTVQSLFPILLDIPDNLRQQIIEALNNPKKYESDYSIPTVAQDDPAYNPIFTIDLMWRGPTWAAPNYFILQGLRRHNYTSQYKKIGNKWLNQAKKNGIWEMWNPNNGTGYGVQELGMSTSVIDILYKLKQL